MKKTKLLLPLFASTLLFGACSPSRGTSPLNPHADPANLYAFQAATSIGLVGNAMSSPNVMRALNVKEANDALKDTIMSYLPVVEAALTGMDAITSSNEEVSDLAEYETKLTISYKDIALKDTTFTMYYTEIVEGEDQSTSEVTSEETKDEATSELPVNMAKENDDEDDEEKVENVDNDHEDDEEDTEKESKIIGIIKIGEDTYPMHGEKELDVDEYEVSFTYNIDEVTTVTVEQEIENGEQEFEYKIESNGETIYEYSIELENDEVELEVKEAGKTENTIEFELSEKDGEKVIVAKVEQGKEITELTFKKVVAEDGSESYQII